MPTASSFVAHLQFLGVETIAVCDKMCRKIDKAIELEYEHEERHVLKGLRKAVDSLRSDALVYKLLLDAMENYTDPGGHSPYPLLIRQQYVMRLRSSSYTHRANNSHYHRKGGHGVIKNLERALEDTRLLLEENPTGNHHKVTINPSRNKKPWKLVELVLGVLRANLRLGHHHELIGDLKDATSETFVCRQNNKRTFSILWNVYVLARQWTDLRDSAVDNVGNIQDNVGQALDSVLHAFHDRPFAVSPGRDSRVDLSTFAILNHNHEAATRHEKLAREAGKAWVDDRFPKYNVQVRNIDALQTSLFGLLWSGTVEQLKRHGAYSSDDPEGPEFERTVVKLEKVLQEGIVRSTKQRFVIAFCGMYFSGKSMFLNALMGREILPTNSEPHDSGTPHHILSTIADATSLIFPCRLRHVEGQTAPELQIQAEPFLKALDTLQRHKYGRKLQKHRPPRVNHEAHPFDEPSDENTLLHRVYLQLCDLSSVTRGRLLEFEAPGFVLPRMATGEQNVKALVSSCPATAPLSSEFYF